MTRLCSASLVMLMFCIGAAACQAGQSPPDGSTISSRTLGGPRIWFAPFPPNHNLGGTEVPPRLGSLDYDQLFTPSAPWTKAANRVQVFKLYAPFLEGAASDSELRTLFRDLNRRGIALAWEAGPLTPGPRCGQGIEGFGGLVNMTTASRIKALGGDLRFIALDEPFGFGTQYSGPRACHWSANEVARQIVDSTKSLRRVFPNLVVGDIESDHSTVADLEGWLKVYRSVSGSDFPFFHLDIDWQAADWPQRAMALEAYARQWGIRFGVIYNGGTAADTSDLAWLTGAQDHAAVYEMQYAGRPDDVIFQSWNDYPHHLLPETDPTAFTSLIDWYYNTRTKLTIATNGGTQVTGRLKDALGKPVVEAPILFSTTPHSGPGTYAEYQLTGAVPSGITSALIQIDLEGWAGGQGPIDADLYRVSYSQVGDAQQRVPNGNFAQGIANWGISPAASGGVSLKPSDRGGQLLHVTLDAPVTQAFVNSLAFPVTAGATYTVTFAARVAPASKGTGQFVLIWGTPEQSRRAIAFSTATVTHDATTDTTGTATWDLTGPISSGTEIDATYSGGERYWPAFASIRSPSP